MGNNSIQSISCISVLFFLFFLFFSSCPSQRIFPIDLWLDRGGGCVPQIQKKSDRKKLFWFATLEKLQSYSGLIFITLTGRIQSDCIS